MKKLAAPFATLIVVLGFVLASGFRPSPPGLAEGFRNVPDGSRLRMYWRVFGPAWTHPEIDRQLEIAKSAGLGGVTAYFLYPVALDDPARGIVNQRFGSDEFLRTFAYAARKARSLGLRFSVNAGTGWPFGGPTVGPGDAARRLREVRAAEGEDPGPVLRLGGDERLVAAFVGGTDMTEEARRGALRAPLAGELRAYIDGPAGMLVKRPANGGEGAALDHYSSGALTRWLKAAVEPLLDAAPGLVESVGCDSLEVYHANWTADLPHEFARRRGYDLIPRLPGLFDDAEGSASGIRFDFWRTLAELTEERFTAVLGDWCRHHGVGLEMEPYGTPPDPMTAAERISVPTGEHYEWKGYAVQRYVASMAHIGGRTIVGAEAWTWAGLPNRLGDSLGDLKLVSDMTFLLGANDLTGVDFPYSPGSAGAPGWMPYYGPVMGPANPQWRFFPSLVGYLNRCQWLLRQGQPVRKVAVYLPVEDAFSAGPVDQMLLDFAVRDRLATGHPTSEFGLANGLRHHSDLLHGLIRAGYDYDGLDFWAVERLGGVKDGRLAVGPAAYEAVVLPDLGSMDFAALSRIHAFCRAGGTAVAVGRLPDRAAGWKGRERGPELRRLISEIFGESPVPGEPHPCGKGRGVLVAKAGEAAAALSRFVVPSVAMVPAPETVGFVHRRLEGREVFFFANVGPDPVRFAAEFPGPAGRFEAWDALTGTVRLAADRVSRIDIGLPPHGSIFLVRGGRTADAAPALSETGTPFAAAFAAGISSSDSLPKGLERLDLDPRWDLTFEGPDAPPPAELARLTSWTELRNGRFFSGAGTYRGRFEWKGAVPGRGLLRFEEVREAAEVKLNGHPLGIVFSPPFAVAVGSALIEGTNELEITVVNLPLNRFLGLPDEEMGPLRARFGARFPAPEEKKVAGPAPSGLIGRVWLEVRR